MHRRTCRPAARPRIRFGPGRREAERGYRGRSIRTDYQFTSLDETETLTRFFLGDELADRVRSVRLMVLPECTGLWWRSF